MYNENNIMHKIYLMVTDQSLCNAMSQPLFNLYSFTAPFNRLQRFPLN